MDDRWSVADVAGAVAWCRDRARRKIRCTIALLAEYAVTAGEAATAAAAQRDLIAAVAAGAPGASVAIKPTSIGLLVDPVLYEHHLAGIAHAARAGGVPLELDMEGRPFVDATFRSALRLTGGGIPATIALQAYLDRTPRDIDAALAAGTRIRLVKGAYLGDTTDFAEIQDRFRACAGRLIASGAPFSAATHDPELLAWLREKVADRKDRVEFSFLKGLAGRTGEAMAADGWTVAEYVPCGPGGDSYRKRRMLYLEALAALGRAPAP